MTHTPDARRIEKLQKLAFELEKHLISPKDWNEEILSNFPKEIQQDLYGPYPTGIGHREDIGWFCIESGGQGPYIIWTQNGIEKPV